MPLEECHHVDSLNDPAMNTGDTKPRRRTRTVPDRNVAVLVETDDLWGRSVVKRITELGSQHRWRFLLAPRDNQHRLRLPRRWNGQGVIASIRDRSLATHLKASGLPVVDVSAMLPLEKWFTRVSTDDRIRAQMAADHLSDRGYRSFAVYAPPIGRYAPQRALEFERLVRKRNWPCERFLSSRGRTGWGEELVGIERWLKSLPDQTAVFAADPHPARQLAEVCQYAGIEVPDRLAILSGDDDDLLCQLAEPNLSAVQLDCGEIGRQAVTRLNQMMRTGRIPKRERRVSPVQVMVRQSTNRFSVSDGMVSEALQIMSRVGQQPLTVDEVAKQLLVSRRTLELRFRSATGRSPAEAMRAFRLEQAKHWVLQSGFSLTEIAMRLGFPSSAGFSQQFRSQFGDTPSAFRKRFRRE
ncbi:AraC family transcriptional regulator [Rhodopirellula halodulae]|uniref:AraC family transcriptional regulator n=1 Tax=Rhodopirellula halodulae TaxID=2894198 RepID=UPI001E32EC1C|nr:xylose operon transcription regulator XylR [Rhodopirellula sp. JC737]MCC9657101.1 substrate-binding domain-containing protein [Rhodopirellula sp. JC737]